MPLGPLSSLLRTPPIECLVGEGVFDAFGWCASDVLEWRRGQNLDGCFETPIEPTNPARMVFVMRSDCAFLPRELARLHAFGLGLTGEWALAPYAIDDATDELFARRVRPGDLLWLAADNLNALFWGLHDWAHFHNHGPFEERAWTELQCDAAALVWLHVNRETLKLSPEAWEQARAEVSALSAARFAAEEKPFDAAPLASERLVNLA